MSQTRSRAKKPAKARRASRSRRAFTVRMPHPTGGYVDILEAVAERWHGADENEVYEMYCDASPRQPTLSRQQFRQAADVITIALATLDHAASQHQRHREAAQQAAGVVAAMHEVAASTARALDPRSGTLLMDRCRIVLKCTFAGFNHSVLQNEADQGALSRPLLTKRQGEVADSLIDELTGIEARFAALTASEVRDALAQWSTKGACHVAARLSLRCRALLPAKARTVESLSNTYRRAWRDARNYYRQWPLVRVLEGR